MSNINSANNNINLLIISSNSIIEWLAINEYRFEESSHIE